MYFILNKDGYEEIFERIHMLAGILFIMTKILGFYAGAILLRYEYPSMIITNTKQIFLKRLKRNKKMITEQGSSDESESKTESKQIQLHTNTFLSSVNSSQLSKKTNQLVNQHQFSDFITNSNNHNNSLDQQSIHNIHNPAINPKQLLQQQSSSILNQSFAEKLLRLSKNVSLTDLVEIQTIQINLHPNQEEVNHLLWDFDQINQEQTIGNYQKLKKNRLNQKSNNNKVMNEFYNNYGTQFPQKQQANLYDHRKKITNLLINDDNNNKKYESVKNHQNYKINSYLKNNQNNNFKKMKQMKYSQIYNNHYQPQLRTKLYSEYEINKNHNTHDTNNNTHRIHSNIKKITSKLTQNMTNREQIFEQEIHTPIIKSKNFTKKPTQRQIYYNAASQYQYTLQQQSQKKLLLKNRNINININNNIHHNHNEQKQSIKSNILHRHRSNNIIGLNRQSEFIHKNGNNHVHNLNEQGRDHNGKDKKYTYAYVAKGYNTNRKEQIYQHSQYNQQINHKKIGSLSQYSHKINNNNKYSAINNINKKYTADYNPYEYENNDYPSPHFKQPQINYRQQLKQPSIQYRQHLNHPIYSLHETNPSRCVSPPIGLITNLSPDNFKYPNHHTHNKYPTIIDTNNKYHSSNNMNYPLNMEEEIVFDDKVQKKRKIRQKAAQLLHKVRSQQYLTGKLSTEYIYTNKNKGY